MAPLLLLLGCWSSEPVPTAADVVIEPASAAVAFTNPKGEIVCPVMGDVIASPDRAAGALEHEGITYYFCCNSCDVAFREDPEMYVDGRHLATLGRWGDETVPEADPKVDGADDAAACAH